LLTHLGIHWRWWPGWFSLRRALLALFPALTSGFPVKKWAPAAALAAALFFLLGAEVATQRSFFMTAVVLIAVTFRTPAAKATPFNVRPRKLSVRLATAVERERRE
jgi:predicted membrane metal-binding protein